MSRANITIQKETAEKLREYRDMNNISSIDQVVNQLLGNGTSTNVDFISEAPAFTLIGETNRQHETDEIINVSWEDLKQSKVGDSWVADMDVTSEKADVMFKDDEGAFIRFIHTNTNTLDAYYGDTQVSVQYFHFL